jgi:hypothetical protein
MAIHMPIVKPTYQGLKEKAVTIEYRNNRAAFKITATKR